MSGAIRALRASAVAGAIVAAAGQRRGRGAGCASGAAGVLSVGEAHGLAGIVQRWKETGADSWPWVWCWRNENGPLYVFVGCNAQTIERIEQLARENPNRNFVLVCPEREAARHADLARFHRCRVGIVESPVVELDLENRICMLRDERVLEFDELVVS